MDHPLRRQPAAGGPARITGAQSVGEAFLAIAQDLCPAGCVDRPVDATAARICRFAALTTASTSWVVMSPWTRVISMVPSVHLGQVSAGAASEIGRAHV